VGFEPSLPLRQALSVARLVQVEKFYLPHWLPQNFGKIAPDWRKLSLLGRDCDRNCGQRSKPLLTLRNSWGARPCTMRLQGLGRMGLAEAARSAARPALPAFLVYRVNNSTREEEKHSGRQLGG